MTLAGIVMLGLMISAAPQAADDVDRATQAYFQQLSERAKEIAEKQAREWGYRAEPGASYIDLMIPPPINEEQIAHYGQLLQLSEAQFQPLLSSYKQYLEDDWRYREQHVQALWDRSAEIATGQQKQRTFELADQFVALLRDRDQAVAIISAREDRIFTELIPFLNDDQIARLDRVKMFRTRERCRMSHGLYPGCNTDLTLNLFALERAGHDMTPRDVEQFESDRINYERAATELFERAFRQRRGGMNTGTYLFAEIAAMGTPPPGESWPKEKSQPIMERRKQLIQDAFAINRTIYDLNEKYVQLFAAQLPSETGDELLDGLNADTYRVVYPNPFDVAELLTLILSFDGLAEETVTLIDATQSSYLQQRDAVSATRREVYLEWWDYVASRSGFGFDEYGQYRQRMQELQSKRKECAQKVLDEVTANLTAEQINSVQSLLDARQARIDEFERNRKGLQKHAGYDWPACYD